MGVILIRPSEYRSGKAPLRPSPRLPKSEPADAVITADCSIPGGLPRVDRTRMVRQAGRRL